MMSYLKQCKSAVEQSFDCVRCCFFCDDKETCDSCCDKPHDNCELCVGEDEKTYLKLIEAYVPDAVQAITEIVIQMDKLEKRKDEIRNQILQAMEKNGVKKFENDKVSFIYVEPTTRTSVDSAKLKKKYPDIASECSKVSKVSASVRISIK